jgi:hypothetical protein
MLGAVVVTVTTVETGPPLGVIGLVVGVHVDKFSPAGSMHAIVTAELNPPIGVTVTVNVAGEPAFTGDGAGAVAVIVKSGAVFVPLPVRVNDCGLVLSASVKTSLAVSEGVGGGTTVGLNVTLTAQEAPAAMLAPQVLAEMAKSVLAAAGLPPVMAAANAIAAFVLFVSVTVWAALVVPITTVPKARVDPGAGDTTKVGISVNFAMNASDVPPSAF